ncbi:hypothetical protein YW7DRAFT_05024 [Streptomyces sp. AmelKG-E11A]|nr:hypothetical protein YW7DRAFT_05024 [Streptomyces sp. AmelKG-E11A]
MACFIVSDGSNCVWHVEGHGSAGTAHGFVADQPDEDGGCTLQCIQHPQHTQVSRTALAF